MKKREVDLPGDIELDTRSRRLERAVAEVGKSVQYCKEALA
jgi:hypothetical protein